MRAAKPADADQPLPWSTDKKSVSDVRTVDLATDSPPSPSVFGAGTPTLLSYEKSPRFGGFSTS